LLNDFEEVVFTHYPLIASLKKLLYDEGAAVAFMSGSGSTVVGFFHDASLAESLAGRLDETYAVSLTKPSFIPDLD
jgi:4-diphosphocytidyl-2-C-methyl-D-erythritol kinase